MKHLLTLLLALVCLPSFGQRFVEELPNLAALKARKVGGINKAVFIHDYDKLGSGGGGTFIITNSAILVDEIFRVASTDNAAWSYDRVFSGPIDYRWGGAVGDGTPGDNAKITAVFNAAVAKGYAVMLPNLIGSNATNQFELLLSPPLKANQRYLQVGASGGLQIYTDNATNWIFQINGVRYTFPSSQGVAGSALMQDGAGNITWQIPPSSGTNVGTNVSVTFDSTVFQLTAVTNVTLKSGALTTNLVFKGAPSTPNLDVPGINIDASTGTEFSKSLASSTTMGIINFPDDVTIHFTVTNTVHTLTFTNTITWLSGIVPTINTNAVNVFHFTKKGGRIFGSDPEQLSNVNLAGLATLAGVGVVVKTNSSAFGTFSPLPIIYGGTGTNDFSTVADGNVIFHKLSGDSLDVDDAQFVYNKSTHTLTLNRTVPNGQYQLLIAEGSGGVPQLTLFANKISELSDNLILNSPSNVLSTINGTTALKVSVDSSVVAGAGSTSTTRTNQFLYLSTSAGVPTGVPVVEAGHVAINYDSSNNHLYVFSGGSWRLIDVGDPVAVAHGGTGANLSASTNGTMLFFSTNTGTFQSTGGTANSLIWVDDTGTTGKLLVYHAAATGQDLLELHDGGGFSDNKLSFFATQIDASSTLNLNTTSGANIILKSQGVPALTMDGAAGSIIIGDGTTTTTRQIKFLYIPTSAGPPTGVPFSEGAGVVPIVIDTVNTNLYGYIAAGWRTLGGSGGGGAGTSDNWQAVAGNPTNSFLNGNGFANKQTATNGFATGSTLLTANSLSMPNAGGAATVVNGSGSRLSHLDLSSGTGAETYLQFLSSNTVAGSFDTNRIFNAFYGLRAASGVFTNALPTTSGGTGTNIFAAKGVPYYNNVELSLDSSANFIWDYSAGEGSLNLTHSTASIVPQLQITDTDTGTTYFFKSKLESSADYSILSDAGAITITPVADLNIKTVNGSVIVGDGTTTPSRTNMFLFVPTTAGPPTGVPIAHAGTIPLVIDSVNTNLYIYAASAWRNIGGPGSIGGDGGGGGANWYTSGSPTNSFLDGDAFVNRIRPTNGVLFPSGASLGPVTLGPLNSGNAAIVVNNSASRLTHLDLKGGNGAETYLLFFSSNTVAGSFDTNRVFNAFYGSRSDNTVVTNSLTVGIGTSGTFARAGGTVFINKTPTGNVLTGEDDLMTFSVTGGSLAVDKDRMLFHCVGQWAGNGNTKQIKAYFGSQQLFATGAQAFNNTDWTLDVEITRDNATGQIADVRWSSGDTLLSSSSKVSFPAETLSGAVIFKLTGEATLTNDINERLMVVEFKPAP